MPLGGDDHWLSRSESRVKMLMELDGFLAAQLRHFTVKVAD